MDQSKIRQDTGKDYCNINESEGQLTKYYKYIKNINI